eukprot:gene5618-11337_t
MTKNLVAISKLKLKNERELCQLSAFPLSAFASFESLRLIKLSFALTNNQDVIMCGLTASFNKNGQIHGWDCLDGHPVSPICSQSSVSSWAGVSCTDGYITKIRINHKNFNCTLPDSIGQIHTLKSLSLFETGITGMIPKSIGNLKSLEHLQLQGNEFSGSIPNDITKLTNLKELWLANNQLSGSIPVNIGYLTKLTYLGLSNNKITGSIPQSIQNMKNIRNVHLDNNKISGIISKALCNTPLTSLYLYWINMEGNNELECIDECLLNIRDKKYGKLTVCTTENYNKNNDNKNKKKKINVFTDFITIIRTAIVSYTQEAYTYITYKLNMYNNTINKWIQQLYKSPPLPTNNRKRTFTTTSTTTSNKRKRSTSGLFFYRRSVTATIITAISLSLMAALLSFSIATVIYPSRSSGTTGLLSASLGARELCAPAA